jgi:hypothetical protein
MQIFIIAFILVQYFILHFVRIVEEFAKYPQIKDTLQRGEAWRDREKPW